MHDYLRAPGGDLDHHIIIIHHRIIAGIVIILLIPHHRDWCMMMHPKGAKVV